MGNHCQPGLPWMQWCGTRQVSVEPDLINGPRSKHAWGNPLFNPACSTIFFNLVSISILVNFCFVLLCDICKIMSSIKTTRYLCSRLFLRLSFGKVTKPRSRIKAWTHTIQTACLCRNTIIKSHANKIIHMISLQPLFIHITWNIQHRLNDVYESYTCRAF